MTDLVAFLRARLDEDEQYARSVVAGSSGWSGYAEANEAAVEIVFQVMNQRLRFHAARHGPGRVLTEVESKRRILAEIESVLGEPANEDIILCLLALPYVDHPDYDESWKPCPT
jgi:Family of unknown function (DUF6221)